MRKLIMFNMVTLDGCFEGEKNWDLGFHDLVWGKELEEFSLEQLRSADMLVFGRTTYEGMAKYWPTAESEKDEHVEIVDFMNRIKKVVCSSTLKSAGWNNTSIVRDAVAELPKLKQQGNGNMFVFGSSILCEALMKANLFDEYRLVIVPVILGKGRRLFNQELNYQKLKLLESRPLSTGGVILRYAPMEDLVK